VEQARGDGRLRLRETRTRTRGGQVEIGGGAGGIAPALPAVLGSDISGTVIAVGDGVNEFKMGDAVYGAAAARGSRICQ
jgi:NADPH2:quinone reductase